MVKKILAGRYSPVAAIAGLLAVLPGCGTGSDHTSRLPQPSSVASARAALPNPFTVVSRFTEQALGLDSAGAIAVGPDGNSYVTDASQRVTVISSQGKVLRRWGKPGSGPGEFHSARLTVAPDGTVYVADSGNSRVQVFTPDGRYIREVGGSAAATKAGMLAPFDLVVDEKGNVYVADDQLWTLSRISAAGGRDWRIGGDGESDPDFIGHFHLAMTDAHRRIVATNDDKDLILYVDEKGHKVDVFGGDDKRTKDGPCDATVDAKGNVYVLQCLSGVIVVYDARHKLVAETPESLGVFLASPRFGPDGEAASLTRDGSLVILRLTGRR